MTETTDIIRDYYRVQLLKAAREHAKAAESKLDRSMKEVGVDEGVVKGLKLAACIIKGGHE